MNRKMLGALVLMAAALVMNVNAQDRERADVPFDFVVADRVLPAATYDISGVAANAMLIRDFKNGNGTMIQFQPADGKQVMHAKLVFHTVRRALLLYQAWSIDGQGIQLRESKLEKEQALASNQLRAARGGYRPPIIRLYPREPGATPLRVSSLRNWLRTSTAPHSSRILRSPLP